MKHVQRLALAATVLVMTALVAACGGSDHDQADTSFVQQMIPHHRQAVQMARMAATHDAGPQVSALARKIEAAQGPEIEEMTGWLRSWGEKVPGSTSMGSMSGGSTGGMMSADDMGSLDRARGRAFDRLFLTQMVQHHSGAVAMADKELADGSSPDATKLAASIKASQSAEIAQMRKLLTALPAS